MEYSFENSLSYFGTFAWLPMKKLECRGVWIRNLALEGHKASVENNTQQQKKNNGGTVVFGCFAFPLPCCMITGWLLMFAMLCSSWFVVFHVCDGFVVDWCHLWRFFSCASGWFSLLFQPWPVDWQQWCSLIFFCLGWG